MSRYYHAILELLEHRGFALPRSPVHLSQVAKIAIVLRYALI
jgi:phytoene synthase